MRHEPRAAALVRHAVLFGLWLAAVCLAPLPVRADGKLVAPREYPGSLEEKAQEAILVFHGSGEPGGAVEDLILKITVAGPDRDTAARTFGWVVPFPNPPTAAKEDPRLFRECFDYVQARSAGLATKGPRKALEGKEDQGVEVLSRKVVGTYDVAVVRERAAGALNEWLEREGFQTLDDGEDVIAFYRRKGYVFACIKVSGAALAQGSPVDLHPLRFTFETGGRDGIYFPLKMTGLQSTPFDVNLHVFYRAWLNDKLNRYGYVHRGFALEFRDWDSPSCKPNAGKSWSAPEEDPYLAPLAARIPTLKALFQKLHPGARYYLTNIQARQLKPADVRHWADDLWLFPYYTDPDFVPYDARPGGPAADAWRDDESAPRPEAPD
ncbi:MAG: DUF2330 domain-containing protein [Planctomycetes bacterium]|nr:DUF2330 domain-containing protein [Planctomycetota bacterium]